MSEEPSPPPAGPSRAPLTVGGAGSVPVEVQFDGVSPLYRGYFATPEWVAELGRGLGSCVTGRAVVVVSYDTVENLGKIVLHAEPQDLSCHARPGGDALDVSALAPITTALGRYRDTLAAQRDVRLASFRVGIRVVEGMNICDLWAGGQFPPDGSTFSPCVGLAGNETCLGERHEGTTSLRTPDPDVAKTLARCLTAPR